MTIPYHLQQKLESSGRGESQKIIGKGGQSEDHCRPIDDLGSIPDITVGIPLLAGETIAPKKKKEQERKKKLNTIEFSHIHRGEHEKFTNNDGRRIDSDFHIPIINLSLLTP